MEKQIFFDNYNDEYFKNLNISIEKGSFISLIGPNASGKTMLLSLIFYKYSSKYIIGYADENNSFLANNLYEALLKILELNHISKKQSKVRIKRIITQLDINIELLYKNINRLTNSEKKICSIIINTVINPNILLLDNTLSGINFNNKKKIIKYLKYLKNRGMTIIIATNDLENSLFADETVVLNCFNVVACGKTLDILTNEKMLNSLNLEIPFMVDLSLKLKFYNLLNKTVLDIDRMVDILWK